jgi:predicted nucleic acid-binding Zn ribbon protein
MSDQPTTTRPRARRRGPKRRGAVELESVLREVIERHVPTELQRLTRARNLWLELLPPGFADHVWPMLVQGGRLIVHVHDSQWLHEMTYWRQDVLAKLRAAWPDGGIEIVEGFVGELPPLRERRLPVPPEPEVVDRTPVLDAEVPTETVDALNAIRDPELRDVLAQARVTLGKPR